MTGYIRQGVFLFFLILCVKANSTESLPDEVRRHQLLIFTEKTNSGVPQIKDMETALPGYRIREVAKHQKELGTLELLRGSWFIATPVGSGANDQNPWDEAYSAARKIARSPALHSKVGKNVYVEPNVASTAPTFESRDGPMPPDWPNGPHFGWHLDDEYTELAKARAHVIPGGCVPRITILDTGIYGAHKGLPRHIRTDLQYNFFDGSPGHEQDIDDPGTSGVLKNPGHGTATIAILAGGKVPPSQNAGSFEGDLGGAPDAEIVPVRISDSVVHLWTKEMFEGLDYAAHLPDAGTKKYCDVISISAGGLPSRAWAEAVNAAYGKGIVIVAAAGNNFANLPTHFLVYPSRFSRVVTAAGVMANYRPYVAPPMNSADMQGNYGPDSLMSKAVAAYTPNIPWAKWGTVDQYALDGQGTSAATPQIAAAFALWLQSHAVQDQLQTGYTWVEASSQAIFSSADRDKTDPETRMTYFGNGLLKANRALQTKAAGPFKPQDPARVSFPFWRIILGLGGDKSAMSEADMMHELEALQLVLQSPELSPYAECDVECARRYHSSLEKDKFIDALLRTTNISVELKTYLSKKRLSLRN